MSNLIALFSIQDDPELIERLKRREPQAMADAYDRYGKLAFSLILGIVKNEAVAEDLLRESFIKVWNRVDGLHRDRGNLGVWILATARNHAISYLRSGGSKPPNGVHPGTLEAPRFYADFEPGYHNIERIEAASEAFNKLNDRQRQTLERAFFEGLSLTEIAATLQQPPGAALAEVRRALELLRSES
jgi:RNA polymerase sigma-70 factor (ECF subfamily)